MRLFFRSFVLTIVARCSSNRYWQDWIQALMKDLTANIDVILQNYGHFFSFWHLGKLHQMLKMRCDQQRLRGSGWTAVTVDHNTLRHYFLWDKDKGLGLQRRASLVLAQLAAWSGSFMAAECICHWCGGSDWCIASRWFGEVPLRLVGLAYGSTRPFLLLDSFQTIFRALHHQTSMLLNNG